MEGVLDVVEFFLLAHTGGVVDDTAEMNGGTFDRIRCFGRNAGPIRAVRQRIGLEVHDEERERRRRGVGC